MPQSGRRPQHQKQTFAVQKGMSALPPKADMCGALADVCFGPKADITSLDHFVGLGQQRGRNSKVKRLRGLEIDGELKFGGLLNRELSRFRSLENTINISRSLLPQVVIVDPIGNQTAGRHKIAVRIDRGEPE